jgi:threonine synthase
MSGLIATYRNRLPLAADAPPLSLGEGNTPLVELVNILLPESVRLWVKIEGANPTRISILLQSLLSYENTA